ncbi:hypothetical protein GCM10022295_22760 [Streptomyces osmaniensis]|uniref:Uncharacterized protein n=1 Tax=Streptomyces osmaniensis TaxID=593134 RepID=A0ABP6VRI6_9ACTN
MSDADRDAMGLGDVAAGGDVLAAQHRAVMDGIREILRAGFSGSEFARWGGLHLDGPAGRACSCVRLALDLRLTPAAQGHDAILGHLDHCPQRFVAALAEQA